MHNTDNKKLTFTVSILSSVLTVAALLLQLYGVLIVQLTQQQHQLTTLRMEAVLARNTALQRYRRARQRYYFRQNIVHYGNVVY